MPNQNPLIRPGGHILPDGEGKIIAYFEIEGIAKEMGVDDCIQQKHALTNLSTF